MQILSFDVNNDTSVDAAVKAASEVLQSGGTVVYPTDTAYGLGANALSEAAIEKIFRIKQRAKEKPLSIGVKNVAMAKKFAVISPSAEKFLREIWPGPITVILHKRSMLPDILTNGRPIGLRCSKNCFNKAIFRYINFPITATSANISGEAAIYDPYELLQSFRRYPKSMPDLLLDAGPLPKILPSTIIDLTAPEPKILRVGPVNPEELLRVFRETAGTAVKNPPRNDSG